MTRSPLRSAGVCALAAGLSIAPTGAVADPPHGVEFVLRPGVGVWSDSSTTPFSSAPASRFPTTQPGIALQIELGYRFHPRLSAGARAGFQRIGTGDVDGYSARNGVVTAGAYFRYALPLDRDFRHEVWASVGVDVYASFSRTLTPIAATDRMGLSTAPNATRIDYSAIGLPLMLGVDFGVNQHLSVGPVVGASLWIPYDRCASGYDVNLGTPTSTCDPGGLIPNALLFVGLNVRLHP